MFRLRNIIIVLSFTMLITDIAGAAPALSNIGRAASAAEIAAWDIDIRPDFKGLPVGRGNVKQGTQLWENKCTSCHGSFGESNSVFTPLIGGTTAQDILTGKVKSLATGSSPQRTTMMKVATISTLFDYIQRAMPWNEPKSLTADNVYALLAYMLNLADMVDENFELNQDNIAIIQAKMPNRNGMQTHHAMWPGKAFGHEKPDTRGSACMKNCKKTVEISSSMPEYAKSAHGNLADQMRSFGPLRGAVTLDSAASNKVIEKTAEATGQELATSRACLSCHSVTQKMVGPSFTEIAERYREHNNAIGFLVGKIKSGGQGVWGNIPMPPQPTLSDVELKALATWVLSQP